MSTVGPVCHLPPTTTINQPGPVNLPSIPAAQPTLQSLQATVNAMRQVIMIITGQQAQGPQGPRGAAGQNDKSASSKGTWVETARTTDKVKIYQGGDKNS